MKKLFSLLLLFSCATSLAETTLDSITESPWLAVPVITSDPKVGTSAGALTGYLHRFDPLSPVTLFGLSGNYIAPNAITFETEERYRLTERWALAGFAGAACLYDAVSDCNDESNWLPAAGGGIIYTVKPQEQMVVRMDYALGKAGNNGFYIRFGHPF